MLLEALVELYSHPCSSCSGFLVGCSVILKLAGFKEMQTVELDFYLKTPFTVDTAHSMRLLIDACMCSLY